MSPWAILGGISLIGAYEGKRSQEQAARTAYEEQITALDDASELVDQAYDEAIGYLEQGNSEAAGYVIESAKIASRHILEYGNLSIDTQREFYRIADEKLQPFVEQGLFAMDEYASMLGIPNSQGELVPYDVADLRETPGYQFQFEEGQRAVDSSGAARGTQLSGRQMKELTRYGDGLAQLYFNKRLDQLLPMIDAGFGASQYQGNAALSTGQGIAGTQQWMGGNLADIELSEGQSLGNLATSLGTNKANMATERAGDQTTIALGRANAATSRAQSDAAADSSFLNNVFSIGSMALPYVMPERNAASAVEMNALAPRRSLRIRNDYDPEYDFYNNAFGYGRR